MSEKICKIFLFFLLTNDTAYAIIPLLTEENRWQYAIIETESPSKPVEEDVKRI